MIIQQKHPSPLSSKFFFGVLPLFFLLILFLPPTVSGEAQVASLQDYEQGLIAAREGVWDQAAGRFENALAAAPLLPESFFNLAVAYRNSGSPLLASLWFRAYLETADPSKETTALKSEVKDLDLKIEKKSRELLRAALEAAAQIPDDYWEDRQQALETVARLEALSGRVEEAVKISALGVRPASRFFYLRIYGEFLAAGHDDEGALAILQKIEDPNEANFLRQTLTRYHIVRSERDKAAAFLTKIPDSNARAELLLQLAAAYARSAELKPVFALLSEAKNAEQREKIQTLLLLALLRDKRFEEAERIAQEIKASPDKNTAGAFHLARIVLGDNTKVFEDPEVKKPSALYETTLALLWRGEKDLAQSGCEKLQSSDYAKIACAYVEAETGHFEKILTALQTLDARVQSDFSLSLFRRLVVLNRWEDIQKMIASLNPNPGAQAALLAESASILMAQGQSQQALTAAGQATDIAVSMQLGFVLRRLADWGRACGQTEFSRRVEAAEKVIHWSLLAAQLRRQPSVVNLEKYLAESPEDLMGVVARLEHAADDWERAQNFITSIEKRHRA